ncbi:MAG TPA: FAD binding domain-containing protein [Solirubrobacteraceae bacterium]|nr:FAD binding domain-containing protein [Solirubrobacteraceae bacterium]
MKPAPFRYAAPDSLTAALELVADEDARPLAGGQSLVPLLNFRLARPGLLVDLNPVTELVGIEVREGTLCLGAMTRQAALLRSDVVAAGWPLLRDAVRHVGHAAIRNRGTVGGSVAHADPAAELPVALTALDARFRIRSVHGERVLSSDQLFCGALTTALQTGELLVEIEVPPVPAGARMAFAEHSRTHGDFASAGVAVVHAPGERAAVALLGAGPVPVRVPAAERALLGGAPAAEVAGLAAAGVEHDHRRAVIRTLIVRALERIQ